MSNLMKIGKYLIRLICVCVVTLIPKKKSIWIFGAWFGKSFSDNPKYMYQYVASLNTNDVEPIWITKDLSLAIKLKKNGVRAYHFTSLAGIYFQLRASVAFVSHAISSDLNPLCIGLNTKRVQLWHGVPLKKIGFDDQVFNTQNILSKKHPKLFSFLLNDKFDMIISTGSCCSRLFSSAFNEPLDKIVHTGFPRNDVFLVKPPKKSNEDPFKVIYMPTFRGGRGAEFDLFELFGFNFDELEEKFRLSNIELHIRTHPANCPSVDFMSRINGVEQIKISSISDIYEEINNYDCLVTDYSSIMFDFAISQKPILFAPFDLDNYLKADRGFYYPYSAVSGGDICTSWPELIEQIICIKNNPDKYINSNELVRSFHDDILLEENGFSLNVFNQVKKKFK